MNRIKINGIDITIGNGNISIINNKVIVDGKTIDMGEQRDVYITGNVNNIQCNGNVTVEGIVKGNVDASGSVKCNSVEGDIDAGGSVQSGAVGGNIDAGGSVNIRK